MTITIEDIKAEQTKITEMIAAFESSQSRTFSITEQSVDLEPGEEYAGIIVGRDGAPSHHLILLPGEADGVTWGKAEVWAKKAGGELPTRREQSLLHANLKEQFQCAWYWSSEQHVSDSGCAWCQGFSSGNQNNCRKSRKLRARAVRRLGIASTEI